jgi:hypothetical protein
MDKDAAIQALENLIRNISLLRKVPPFSAEHTRWVTNSLYLLEEIFGRNSRIYRSFAALEWQYHGPVIAREDWMEYTIHQKHKIAYLTDLESARGILTAAIDQIRSKGIESVYNGKDTPKESSEIIKILSLIDNKLRKVIRQVPKRESDVLDALEALFVGAGLDKEFVREKESIVYSSKTYHPDFSFKRIDTVVEGKFSNNSKREKEIIHEINDDILAYRTKYSNLIFVIYDLGFIRDQDLFKGSIEQNHPHVVVRIIKH